MSQIEKFAPSVKLGRDTVTPPGWMWILGFALGGCEWAIKEADKPEFRAMVRRDLRRRKREELVSALKEHESRAEELRAEIHQLDREEASGD